MNKEMNRRDISTIEQLQLAATETDDPHLKCLLEGSARIISNQSAAIGKAFDLLIQEQAKHKAA